MNFTAYLVSTDIHLWIRGGSYALNAFQEFRFLFMLMRVSNSAV